MTAGNDNNEFFRVITFITMMILSTAAIWVVILIFAGII
jgi:hypothetical protein